MSRESVGAIAHGEPDPLALAVILRALPRRLSGDRSTLGEILAALEDRGIAFILLLFSIPAIVPTPGIPAGMVFGTALAIIAVQMIAGGEQFRLPGWLAQRSLRRRHVETFASAAASRIERLGQRVRPRWSALTTPKATRWLGVAVFVMGGIIALPIPFGNVVPGLAVFLMAFGLAERDGATVALGLATSVLAAGVTAGVILGGYWLAESALLRWPVR